MSFELDVAKWVSKVKVDMDQAFRELALEMARRIIERTPVRSGNLRGAWRAGLNSMPVVDDRATPDDRDGSATLAWIKAVIDQAKVGDAIYIANGAAYAAKMEFGSSTTEARGMIRLTVLESQAIANEVVANLEI